MLSLTEFWTWIDGSASRQATNWAISEKPNLFYKMAFCRTNFGINALWDWPMVLLQTDQLIKRGTKLEVSFAGLWQLWRIVCSWASGTLDISFSIWSKQVWDHSQITSYKLDSKLTTLPPLSPKTCYFSNTFIPIVPFCMCVLWYSIKEDNVYQTISLMSNVMIFINNKCLKIKERKLLL